MKSLPEELAFRIAISSQNPFFYLINGVWNKRNFEKLIQRNYTFPSIVRHLIRSRELKLLQRLCCEYKEELTYLPTTLQQDIQQLLQDSSLHLSSNTINNPCYNDPVQEPSYPQPPNPKLYKKRKLSETALSIPSLKIIHVETIVQKGLSWVIQHQLQTGEYTYLKEENETEEMGKVMSQYLERIHQRFEAIKHQIADANGCIPSATEKSENPEYYFMYLYALMSSLNFKETTWHHQLLMNYHPSFIKIKVTEEVLSLFSYLNNTFECSQAEMLKPTYYTLKEMYEEANHQRIKSQGYMDFIFDHKEYEPLLLDTLNNLPLTTWKLFHSPSYDSNLNSNDNDNDIDHDSNLFQGDNNYNNEPSSTISSSQLVSESSLSPDRHNILYILSHNFFLGMHPSCHLLYLYDKYIDSVLQLYDEDNDQIFKYYSGIASNPDESLRGFFYYTSLILLLRSPSIRCLFVNPEELLKTQQMARSHRRQIHPYFLSSLNQPNRQLFFVSNPLSIRSLNIEPLLPYLNSTSSSSSAHPSDTPIANNENEKAPSSSSTTSTNAISMPNASTTTTTSVSTNDTLSNSPNKEGSEESLDDIASKKFRIQVLSREEPITLIKSPKLNRTSSQTVSMDATKSNIAENPSSPPISNSNSTVLPIPLQKPKVMVVIKNNLLSFTSQVNEWHIRRHHSLLMETLDSTLLSLSDKNDTSMASMDMVNEMEKVEDGVINSDATLVHDSSTSISTTSMPSFSSSLSTPELYYTAVKTSKLISHAYDEDWYIRRCLPNKKNKNYWSAKIYLY